jgi:hypothetical protein
MWPFTAPLGPLVLNNIIVHWRDNPSVGTMVTGCVDLPEAAVSCVGFRIQSAHVTAIAQS